MVLSRSYRALVTLLAVLFLFVQVVTVAHATNFGDNPHEHEGIACDIGVTSQDDQKIIPVETVINAPIVQSYGIYSVDFITTFYVTPQGRAPPPRGPPTIL